MTLHANRALLPDGWADDVRVDIAADGRIGTIQTGVGAQAGDQRVGLLFPAPVNAHSHAFQRAMAGLTEARGPDPKDTFWTWRRLMFRFLDQLDPDDVEAITGFVQMEMLEAGYATQVEFHYLHHQPGGTPYEDLAEMSARVAAAAADTGIGLTLLPVQYQYGGCDGRPLGPGQIRFGTDLAQFARLLEGAEQALRPLPADTVLGVAPHSLRAVAPEALPVLAGLRPGTPIHMHLAEQMAEVDELRTARGRRPVEWLLEEMPPDARWCLIHCTQMLPHETRGLAETGAVAGLCPITEANLGDGIFDGVAWLDHGGRIALGSDSNIRIALSEELRMLEYSQRLRDRTRAALASPAASTGRRLFDAILAGGAQAAGRDCGRIAVGAWADLTALDDRAVDLRNRPGDTQLDSFLFAGDDRMVTDVWAAGRHVVRDGRHRDRSSITARFAKTLDQLREAL